MNPKTKISPYRPGSLFLCWRWLFYQTTSIKSSPPHVVRYVPLYPSRSQSVLYLTSSRPCLSLKWHEECPSSPGPSTRRVVRSLTCQTYWHRPRPDISTREEQIMDRDPISPVSLRRRSTHFQSISSTTLYPKPNHSNTHFHLRSHLSNDKNS